MTAKEARQKAESSEAIMTSFQYQTIMSKIEKAVKNGVFKTVIYEKLSDPVKLQLERDGYAISEYFARDQRDDSSTTISW